MIAYQESYDRIAADHISWWRQHGTNPFQDPAIRQANEDFTVALIEKHAPDGVMLDAGCGMGELLMRFPRRISFGVDISEEYLKIAMERGHVVELAPVEKLPYQAQTFSLVVATDILEHVLDVNAAMREMLRVLKPSGVIVARVPDKEPVPWAGQHYEFVHLRIFDEGTLMHLFATIFGCEVLECVVDQNTIHMVARN